MDESESVVIDLTLAMYVNRVQIAVPVAPRRIDARMTVVELSGQNVTTGIPQTATLILTPQDIHQIIATLARHMADRIMGSLPVDDTQ